MFSAVRPPAVFRDEKHIAGCVIETKTDIEEEKPVEKDRLVRELL